VSSRRRSPPVDPLQVMLVEQWKNVLGVTSVGVDRSFASLGGTWAQLEQMLERTEAISGQLIPADLHHLGVTVEELGARIQILAREANLARRAYLARNVSPDATRPPLFFLHGDYGGGGFYCLQLAAHLGRDQPLYAIAPHGLDGEPLPDTIEAMAADRLNLLRTLKRTGPYWLGGHCNGAVIAYEMARQLRAQGEHVQRLVLVTPVVFPPSPPPMTPSPGEGRRLKEVSLRELPELVRDGFAWRFKRLASRLANRKVVLTTHPLVAAVSAARDRFTLEYSRRMRAYWPTAPYPGTVTLLYTSDPDAPGRDPIQPWPRLAERVESRHIPGDHLGCITVHVRTLAGQIRECLDRPDTSPGS